MRRLVRSGAVIAVVGGLAAASGCQSAGGPRHAGAGNDVVCINQPQTGSHIVETRCYTRAEIEERRKADKEMMERAQMNASRPVPRANQPK
jgi:hypothetical protein